MTIDEARLRMARADALIQAASDCLDRVVLEGDGPVRHIDRRRYEHLAHLVGEAVIASELAVRAVDELAAQPGGAGE